MSLRRAALIVAAAAVVGIALGVGAHTLAGPSSSRSDPLGSPLRGQAIWPAGLRRAPAFSLPDESGRRLTLASLRGRPLILAFFDSQCHQECPLEGRTLAAAFQSVPRAERPVVVAVSVNPWADTPGSARRAMRRFGLAGADWHWLLGSRAQLAPVWKAYRIEVRRTSGDIVHTDAIYLIDSHGYERAGIVYPFLPNWVSADLGALARENGA